MVYSSRVQSIVAGKAWWQKAAVTSSTLGKKRVTEAYTQLLFLKSGTSAYSVVSPTFRVHLLISINLGSR